MYLELSPVIRYLELSPVIRCLHDQVNTDGTNAEPFILMGQPKSFVFDLGEGYPTYTLYYDCHGHGVSVPPPLPPPLARYGRRPFLSVVSLPNFSTTKYPLFPPLERRTQIDSNYHALGLDECRQTHNRSLQLTWYPYFAPLYLELGLPS